MASKVESGIRLYDGRRFDQRTPSSWKRSSWASPIPAGADWIRASILAGQTSSQIAEVVELGEEVIHTFERLFFDVRDRLNDGLWFKAYVLHPLLLTLDQFEPASEAYAAVFDRAI